MSGSCLSGPFSQDSVPRRCSRGSWPPCQWPPGAGPAGQGGKLAKQKATTQIVRDLDKIRQLAEDDLPVLKQHLELARAALKATGGQG
jgi:hypothetical protein